MHYLAYSMIDGNTFRSDKEPAVIEKEADNIA